MLTTAKATTRKPRKTLGSGCSTGLANTVPLSFFNEWPGLRASARERRELPVEARTLSEARGLHSNAGSELTTYLHAVVRRRADRDGQQDLSDGDLPEHHGRKVARLVDTICRHQPLSRRGQS